MSTNNTTATKTTCAKKASMNVRYLTVTAMLSAVAFVLMFLEFSIPIMPSFIKLDLSELPALIGSFAMGPGCGVLICLIKNLLHLTITTTGGVGEISNFILGAFFVMPAGWVYKRMKSKKGALIGSLAGAVIMSLISFPSNYFFVYPVYENFMPLETIVAAYQAILPAADELWKCLLIFNVPFNFAKALFSVAITMLVYKKISPILKGVKAR